MKIIKQGSEDNIRIYKMANNITHYLKCEVCGCEFEVENTDKELQYDQKEGVMWVRCPYCRNIIDVK